MNAQPRPPGADIGVIHGGTPVGVPTLRLERAELGSIASVTTREWLVTNGLGGFASGTVGGINTRRYHGLLVAALQPPLGRTVMVSKLDAFAQYEGRTTALGTNEYRGGTIAPDGFRHLHSFHLDGQIPVWTWLVGDALLEQRIWMQHGQNLTFVQWRLLRASSALELEVHPLCTGRDYHWHHRGASHPHLQRDETSVRITPHEGAAPYRIIARGGRCEGDFDNFWNFHHREEAARGLDAEEDLFRPAVFRFALDAGESCTLILTSEPGDPPAPAASLEGELQRQRALLSGARRLPGLNHENTVDRATAAALEQLVLAADQFIVARHSDGEPAGRTVIAGYPWFGDWGRDTMIALPGLTLTTGRTSEAVQMLRTFARHVSEGMLPNRFPDDGEAPEYNTVDATLWYFVAVHLTLAHYNDPALRRELLPILQDIIEWHLRGTRYGIGAETDGLLRAGVPGVQLTWMDAKVGDRVITPRHGKPVEINALWINALRIVSTLCADERDAHGAVRYAALADQATARFTERFWNEAAGYLNDVIDTPSGDDASLRPNQIFALSLPFPLLRGERARAVVSRCLRDLWTPVGLRSLAPGDAAFASRYSGGPAARDAVYHQGTVWSWLLGPFAIAHYRVFGDLQAARELLTGLLPHLREACLGQVSEIFDGDAPFAPAGCFAQAWSVAETLRAWSEIHECKPEAC